MFGWGALEGAAIGAIITGLAGLIREKYKGQNDSVKLQIDKDADAAKHRIEADTLDHKQQRELIDLLRNLYENERERSDKFRAACDTLSEQLVTYRGENTQMRSELEACRSELEACRTEIHAIRDQLDRAMANSDPEIKKENDTLKRDLLTLKCQYQMQLELLEAIKKERDAAIQELAAEGN